MKFPIAVDNDQSNWNAWSNRYWPTVHVVDRRGRVLYGWEGELSYKGPPREETVRKVIEAVAGTSVNLPGKGQGRGPIRGGPVLSAGKFLSRRHPTTPLGWG